jgi:hypothetical protein
MRKVSITRAKSGIFGFRYNRNETIEGYPTSVWNVDSFDLQLPVRKEHLECSPLPEFKLAELREAEKKREREKKRKEENEMPKSRFVVANPDTSGSDSDGLNAEEEEERFLNYKSGYRNIEDYKDPDYESWRSAKNAFDLFKAHRDSLEAPAAPIMSFEDFESGESPLHLGRPMVIEKNNRSMAGRLWMYQPVGDSNVDLDVVPFRPDSLYPLLSLIGMGNEHFRALNDFLETTLPPGYPIQFEIPIGILPLSAVIKTRNIVRKCDRSMDWFHIPTIEEGYLLGEVVRESEYE